MSDHNSAVFNNNCLKVPRNPISNQPFPIYEQKFYNQLQNQATKLRIDSNEIEMKSKRNSDPDKETLKSFIEFYDSIPEYDDVNHLSNKEFYKRLENLKEKQKIYNEYLQNSYKYRSNGSTEWIDDYKKLSINDKKIDNPKKPSIKPFCTTPILNKSPIVTKNIDDVESFLSSDKEVGLKPPSRRSVRIESPSDKSTPEPYFRPKSRANILTTEFKDTNKSPCSYNDIWDDFSVDDLKLDSDRVPLTSRSAPTSPVKNKPTVGFKDGITIPQPFQMTVRDEENRIIDEVISSTTKTNEEKPDLFRAHPVPIESQIPLFDKIMADQEIRSQEVRRKRRAQLNAQMKPFSFTKRDEEMQALTKRLSKSSPSIFLNDIPIKVKQFKAKPVPKNLFSNYIYKKMNEDEFYRALQKKIRAEEMLKASSLPPSMAKREKYRPKYDVCPRSFRDVSLDDETKPKKSKNNLPNYKKYHEQLDAELEALKNDFISTSPRPFKSKTSKRMEKRSKSSCRNSAGSRSSDDRSHSSLELSSINRSNLAAVLRIHSAKKRMEVEMCKKLEETRLKDEARWREKVLRKRPVWQSLAYSNEEDLAMRLQLRRDEQKLRSEEHRYRMQQMIGRVNRQPTLFERQSMCKNPQSRDKLLTELYKDLTYSKSPEFSSSNSSDKRSLVEMRDEAVQAFLEEELNKYNEQESDEEEKEKCDSSSDDDDNESK